MKLLRPASGIIAFTGLLAALPCALAGEFRGVWASPNYAFRTAAEVNLMLDRLVAGNYNALVAEVLSFYDSATAGHGAYYNSTLVPKSRTIAATFDPLGYLCQAAHARGIEVHAWVLPYWASTSDIWSPGENGGNPTIAAHPEWLMVRRGDMDKGPLPLDDGDPSTLTDRYVLDCGSPDVQEYIISVIRELVTHYPVDGINLDGIRYRQTDAGYPSVSTYTNSGLARYRRIYGLQPGDADYLPAPTGVFNWDDFRRREVDELVRRLRAELPTWPNPRQPVRLTADLIVGTPPADCDSFANTSAYKIVFQNWRLWLQQGWLDAAMPMNYKREHCPAEFEDFRRCVRLTTDCWRGRRHVFMGQGCFRNDAAAPDHFANTVAQMRYCYEGMEHSPAEGVVNFSYSGTRSAALTCESPVQDASVLDPEFWPRLAAELYTAPVPTPEMPWRSRSQATEGTVWGRVIHNGLPVDNATVILGRVISAYTDGNGYYVITLAPAVRTGTSYALNVVAAGLPGATHPAVRVLPGEVVGYDFDLGAPPAVMLVGTDSIVRTAKYRDPVPSAAFSVAGASGHAPLNYYVTIPGSPFWIAASPETGVSAGEENTISVSFASGLPTGWYTAALRVEDAAAGDPHVVDVRLTVTPPGDSDADCDVDAEDFGVFQRCFSPDEGGLPPGCDGARLDGDEDVDEGDFARFLNCMRASAVPAPGDCAD